MSNDHQPDQEPTISTGLSIAEAADQLGISENAVRQRIKRGTLPAVKVDGVWSIMLIDHQADQEPTTGRDPEVDYQGRLAADHEPTTNIPAVSPAARAQLAVIRDEFVQPLVDQIAAQAEEIGRLRGELEQARRQIAAQDAPGDSETAPDAPASTATGQESPRSLLARLVALVRRGTE